MQRALGWFRSNPLSSLFFLLLFPGIFLGDGKQTSIDILGAAIVYILYFVSKIYLHKQRELDSLSSFAWILFFSYLIIRTAFSDDVGYSVYACLRYFDAFLLFYIFYCYSNYETAKKYLTGFLTFSVFSLISAFIATENLKIYKTLLPMNLLYPTYGHNNIVNIILLSFTASLCLWIITQKRRYLYLSVLFIIGTLLSFSRAGLILEFLFSALAVFVAERHKDKIKKKIVILTMVLTGMSILLLILPYGKNNFQTPLLSAFNKQSSLIATRENYWHQAIKAIIDRPLFGAGPGTFALISRRYEVTYNTNSLFAHSFLLEQVSELGIIGFIFFLFIFFLIVVKIISYRQDIIKHRQYVAIGSSVIMCLVYGMIDVPLNFLVVWLLFWTTTGIFVGQNNNTTKANVVTRVLVFGSVTALILVYVYSVINFIYKPLDILNGNYISGLLKEDKNMLYVGLAAKLHKNNPDVNFEIAGAASLSGKVKEAKYFAKKTIDLEPLEAKRYNFYSDLLINNHATNELIKFIQFISKQSLTQSQYQTFKQIDFSQSLLTSKYRKDMFIRNDYITNTDYLSVIYYLLGLELINDKPELTEKLWTLARDVSPGWGYFHVELASLKKNVFKDDKKAKQTLNDCKKDQFSKEQCLGSEKDGLEKIGYFKKYIMAIPNLYSN
jgi:O-antigen ligase